MPNENQGHTTLKEDKFSSGILSLRSYYRSPENTAVLILGVLFGAGILFHSIPYTRGLVMKITDLFLFASNAFVFMNLLRKNHSKILIIWSIAAFFLTFLAEYAGVKTGMVFGDYWYGETMKLQIGGVPVVIAFNWLILILATNSLAQSVNPGKLFLPLLSALLIVLFDYVMEPVAMQLDYWQWANDRIPLQNYLAWFGIALVFSYALVFLKIQIKSKLLNAYLIIQFVFFVILRLIL